jgi:hypothetical protein
MLHLNLRRSHGLLAGGLFMLAASGAAVAATPESGQVSKASPRVEWSGEVINSYANRLPIVAAGQNDTPCVPQHCDAFALKVVDSDALTITADAPESTGTTGSGSQVTLRITAPDGSKSVHTTDTTGASPEKPFTVKIKKAAAGDYVIEYFNYFLGSAGFIAYNASATLGAPAAAAPAPAPVKVDTPQAPAPAPAPTATVQEALSLDLKTGKLSAKKLNKSKKLATSVTVSREVKSLTAVLKSGSKVVAKGSLSGFAGTKAVSLKLAKKLKAGTYSLSVSATDAAGASAAKTVKVKVAK